MWQRQQGITLVLSLLVLVTITLLAVSAMRSTTLQEKMAANLVDREVSRQVVEGTLQRVSTLLPPAAGASWYLSNLPVPAQNIADVWRNNSAWQNAGNVGISINGVTYTGQFLVENLGLWTSRQDPTCKPRENPLCERQTYRITIRNQPVQGRAATVVQVVWRI